MQSWAKIKQKLLIEVNHAVLHTIALSLRKAGERALIEVNHAA